MGLSLETRPSVESTRPILEKLPIHCENQRLSIYSLTPSLALTASSFESLIMEKKPTSEISEYHVSLTRLDSKPLQEQRYTVSQKKDEQMSMLAFEAKVQRALRKRFSDQDAVFTHKENQDAKMTVVLERALARRYSGQDAVFKPKPVFAKTFAAKA